MKWILKNGHHFTAVWDILFTIISHPTGSISSCDSGYVHQQHHYHLQYQQPQCSSQNEPSPPVYTAADCRLLQQISKNAVTLNMNSPCQGTSTPPSTLTPRPTKPIAAIQLSRPPTATAYMHIRSQYQQLQQQQLLAMPPPPPPLYNLPPLACLYSPHQDNTGSRHLNHMHGKLNWNQYQIGIQ